MNITKLNMIVAALERTLELIRAELPIPPAVQAELPLNTSAKPVPLKKRNELPDGVSRRTTANGDTVWRYRWNDTGKPREKTWSAKRYGPRLAKRYCIGFATA